MFKPAVADIEKNDRVEVWRIASKKGHNGHNTNRFQVKIAGQLLPITAVIKRAMRRPPRSSWSFTAVPAPDASAFQLRLA
jgi:hypothetical protein